MHKLCKKEQKNRFLAIFSTLESQSDLVLHNMVLLNVSQNVAIAVAHA